MRTALGNRRQKLRQRTRIFVVSIIVLSAITPSSFVSAIPLLELTQPQETVQENSETTGDIQPPVVSLVNGVPESTTPAFVKAESKLTWTPTGVGEVEDSYNIVVARSAEVNDDGKLVNDIALDESNLPAAERDINILTEGAYYWQVQSCSNGVACRQWSQVWTVTVDLSAPSQPIATVTSGLYDRTVEVTGSAEAKSSVLVSAAGKECATTALENGTWSCAFDNEFEYGEYEAQITSSDAAGNVSMIKLTFGVKELFVAPQITTEELPVALAIVPVDETHENLVFKQPATSVIDVVNTRDDRLDDEVPAISVPLSIEGGLVQSSQVGWRVLGVPWYLWAGIGGMLSASWFVSTGRLSRSIAA